MLKKIQPFKIKYRSLSGRAQGKLLRKKVLYLIDLNDKGTVLPLDFKRVKIIDALCCQEFICKLLIELYNKKYEDKFIVFQNLNKIIDENILFAMGANKILAIGTVDGGVNVYGVMGESLLKIFKTSLGNKFITAQNLQTYGIAENKKAARIKLNWLHSLKLLYKIKDKIITSRAKEDVYEPIT